MAKDKCVLCGKDTPYDETTHIDNRRGYVQGCGQTCPGGCDTDDIGDIRTGIVIVTGNSGFIGNSNCTDHCNRTGYELFRYVKPDEPQESPRWKIHLFWVITSTITGAICGFVIYSLLKILCI